MKKRIFGLAKNTSILNKILAVVIAVVVLSTTVLGVVFYKHVSDILVNNALEQNERTLKQTHDYLDYRLRNILLQFNYLEINKEILNTAQKAVPSSEERRRIAQIFEESRNQNQDMIDSIFMCSKSGYMFYEYIKILKPDLNVNETDWYKIAYDNLGKTVWQSNAESEIFVNSSGIEKIRIIKAIRNSFEEPVGVLVFELKEPAIRALLRNVEFSDDGRVYLIDEHGGVVSAVNPLDDDKELLKGIDPVSVNGDFVTNSEVTSYKTLNINDWKIVYAIGKNSLTSELQNFGIFTVYSVLLSLFLVSVLTKIILTWMTKPINKLVGMIKQVEKGNFDVRFNSKYNDEIGKLGDTFDNMCENINDLMKKLTEEKSLKQEAELKVLQEQIKSHFLFNTLDSIYWMSKSGDNEKTANMIAALAKLFRLSLNGGNDITTVSREIEHVSSYLYIEKIRKGEKYVFDLKVDEKIMNYSIPKIILQPLVENGIVHGLYKKKCGLITVRGYESGEELIFEVEDDGGNLNVEAIEELFSRREFKTDGTKGYALLNLRNRLSLVYHKDDVISFKCEPGKFSLVTIKIPKNLPEN